MKRAFQTHLVETRRHAHRLEQIGRALDVKIAGKKCQGMEGLLEEGRELIVSGALARPAGWDGAEAVRELAQPRIRRRFRLRRSAVDGPLWDTGT